MRKGLLTSDEVGPITRDEDASGNDYTLADGESAWLALPGGKVLHISPRTDTISLYVNHSENEDPIWRMTWERDDDDAGCGCGENCDRIPGEPCPTEDNNGN